MALSMPLTRRQPFKTFYIVYLLITIIFFHLPYLCIRFALPRSRPARSWSLKRSILVTVYREILIKLPTKLGLDASRKPPKSNDELRGASFVWIEGLDKDSDAFCGELRKAASVTGVQPGKVLAYWIFRPGTVVPQNLKATEGEEVALYIHGGAFILGSAHPDSETCTLSHGILAHSSTLSRVLSVDYRLAAAAPDVPKNPFPAALLDCVTAYHYLVREMGFAPEKITIAGDSAGGNLALATTRHFVESSISGLGPPGRLISFSSWLDISDSRNGPSDPRIRNQESDIISNRSTYHHRAYLGPLVDTDERKTNRYLSPVSPHITTTEGLFKGFPRTYVSAGGLEMIVDDSIVVAEMMKADGVDVVLDIEPDAIHDYMGFAWMEPERTTGLKKVGEWLDT
uniref:Mannitol dehydrogenase n=1 Tax=Ganoderma boninense TaxID=34458 RepID=A0A5K1K088_9APHY|nr:Mannitol dehydrogenase [Ganoderma boninense]